MKAKQLPSGNYRVQVIAGHDNNGKRIIRSFTAPTEWEAIKLATDFKNGIDNEIKHMTVKQAVKNYIDSRRNIVSASTLYSYDVMNKNRFTSIQNIDIHKLSKLDVQKAINEDVSKGLGYRSVKNSLALYRSALACYDVEIPPTAKFTLPQPKPKKGDLPDIRKVLKTIKGSTVELPCLLALWCGGMRMSEVRGLQYGDVKTNENGCHFIKISRVRLCINGHDVVQERTKTVGSARDIPIPDYMYKLIFDKPHKSETEFIINENYGALKRRYDRLMRKNGIKMTFHELRAQFATIMSILGAKKEVLQMLGGWSNSKTLDDVYNRTPERMLTESMNTLDNFLLNIIEENAAENADNHTESHTDTSESV